MRLKSSQCNQPIWLNHVRYETIWTVQKPSYVKSDHCPRIFAYPVMHCALGRLHYALGEPHCALGACHCALGRYHSALEKLLQQSTLIARYHGEIYGNISLNSGFNWGLAAPRPPRGFPRVLGAWEGPKNNF